MNFKLADYINILVAFVEAGYNVVTISEFIEERPENGKYVALRHDVDRFPLNALHMMKAEQLIGIRSTYYWRKRKHVYRPKMMRYFASKGFEIGYHYEDYSSTADTQKAIDSFSSNWKEFKNNYHSKTVCRHGSPLSTRDSLDLLKSFNYYDLGIVGDTNLDIDYNRTYYITDNGLLWNDSKFNVRDKVSQTSSEINELINQDFINAIKSGVIPNMIHLNVHPDSFQKYSLFMYINYFVITLKGYAKLCLKAMNWYK